MIKGSCLCGDVKLEITGNPRSLSYCHCDRCRKSSGIYSAVLIGDSKDLKIIGEENVVRYKPEEPWKHLRAFCKKCGSPLGDLDTDDGIYVVAASVLDDDPGIKPSIHLNVTSKPSWFDIRDDLKRFDGNYIPE